MQDKTLLKFELKKYPCYIQLAERCVKNITASAEKNY